MESMNSLTTTTAETTQVIGMMPFGEGTISGMRNNMELYECQSWPSLHGLDAWPEETNIGQKMLNPNAKEWEPYTNRAPEEDRCLFLTFSNGYPLTQCQIKTFFIRKFGVPCVEKVYVHKPEPKEEPPLFGKVVFNGSSIPAVVMGGQSQVKFVVNNKPLWCKRFDSNNLGRSSGK